MPDIVECPNCGKKSVVHRGNNIYECLACDFKRDLSKQGERKADAMIFWPTAIAAVIAFYILQAAKHAASNNPSIEYQSYSAPSQVEIFKE